MSSLRKTGIVVIVLLISGLSMISCSGDPTDWLEQDNWAQSGPVCYSIPQGWLYNQPPPGGTWLTFLSSTNGIGMKPVIDPTESAELTIAMLQPPVYRDDPDGSALGAFTESAAETLMDLLVAVNRDEGAALIVVTHALDLAARLERVLELREGRLSPRGEAR